MAACNHAACTIRPYFRLKMNMTGKIQTSGSFLAGMAFAVILAIAPFQALPALNPADTVSSGLHNPDRSMAYDADAFTLGMNLQKAVSKSAALQYWESHYRLVGKSGEADPRIGFRFVEWAAGLPEPERFEIASEIFHNSLQSSFPEEYFEETRRQVRFTEPLLERNTRRKWHKLLDDRDEQLFTEIRTFWSRKNAIPSTDVNERLIEHWQRIHFARENFTENDETVYGTDERALIYVRFGPPDRHRRGTLSYNLSEIRNRLYDLVEVDRIHINQIYTLQMNIIQNFSPGWYEYWRYNRIDEEGPIIYIFGRPGGGGKFQLLDSLEEFIPPSGYRSVVIGDRGTRSALRAGYFLQMMIYNEVSTLDEYFGQRLMEYERRWNQVIFQSNQDGQWLGDLLSPNRAANDMRRMQDRAPESVSDIERNVMQYPIYHREYRFIDAEEGPVSLLLMNPSPEIVAVTDMLHEQLRDGATGYQLKQGFNIYKDDERVERNTSSVNRGPDEITVADASVYTAETVRSSDEDVEIEVFSELYVRPGRGPGQLQSNALIGMNRKWTRMQEPLTDNGNLLMSDLVPGSTGRFSVPVRSVEMGVLSGKSVPLSESIQIYFEVYNLQKDEQSGEYRYSITYQLEPQRRRSWIPWRRSSHEVSLSWDAASYHPKDYQFFDVDLTHASSGDHILRIQLEDLASGQTSEREIEIELVEPGD